MSEMQPMIERMARAMARYNYPSGSERDIDEMWDAWAGEAETALAAIREPTPAMIEAGSCGGDIPYSREMWRIMIDAALSYTPSGMETNQPVNREGCL